MKKKIIIFMVLISLFLTGCGSSISKKSYDKVVKERDEYKKKYETLLASINENEKVQTDKDKTDKATDNLEISPSDIEEVNQYKWDSHGYNYVGLELKNNSKSTICLNAQFIFYDENDKIIGTKKPDYVAFESQSNILLYVANEDPFDHYEYKLNPSVDKINKPMQSKLKSDVNETNNKLIFSITNEGDSEAKFVKCTVLFLRAGEAVYQSYSYAGASNGSIAPSETELAEIDKPYNIPYDEYVLFLDGRG